MEMEITVPDEVPVMILPNMAFFPQALLPLHIFEPRYRQMLEDVLATNRLFAVAGLNPASREAPRLVEPPHRVASVGLIRACQKNRDGTSNLILQGLCRVEILSVIGDTPYRSIRIRALASQPGCAPADNNRLRKELARLIALKQKFGALVPANMAKFLHTVEDPETFVDLAAFNLCEDPALRQRLLETLDIHARLALFKRQLRADIDALKLRHRLQGRLADDHISDN
jgi:ATP-dependent Lon protease